MRVTHYNEVKKLQKRVKKAEKESKEESKEEKQEKRADSALPGSPPQYSERMSDISSIRTATTIRTDRETLKVCPLSGFHLIRTEFLSLTFVVRSKESALL